VSFFLRSHHASQLTNDCFPVTVGLVNGTRGVIIDFVRRPSEGDLRSTAEDDEDKSPRQNCSEKLEVDSAMEFLKQQKHEMLPVVYFGVGEKGIASERRILNSALSYQTLTELDHCDTVTILPHTNTVKFGGTLGSISRTQVPLQLAWFVTSSFLSEPSSALPRLTHIVSPLRRALTVHKSQGRSLDAVVMNLGGCFANGQ